MPKAWDGVTFIDSDFGARENSPLPPVLSARFPSEPQWVDEQYILNLERAAIRELSQLPKTQERIRYFLETGKTMRN